MDKRTLKEKFEKIYNIESDAIFRFCISRVSDREQALDLTQETFTRFWRALLDEKKITNTRAFIYTIAHHLIIDWYRKKKSVSLEGLGNEETGQAYEPIDDQAQTKIALDQEGRFVLDSIRKVGITNRHAVYLRFVEDLSPPEIAEILGLSVNATSVRINRGLEELRKITGYNIHDHE